MTQLGFSDEMLDEDEDKVRRAMALVKGVMDTRTDVTHPLSCLALSRPASPSLNY